MQPTDLAYLRIPGNPTLAPDGRHAVVDVTRLDLEEDAYRSRLWLVPTDGTSPARELTRGWRDTSPRFSPDGRWLAFLRSGKDDPPRLHVMPVGGGEPWPVTTKEQHPLGAGEPIWSPDSRRVAYVARVPEQGRYGTAEGVGPDKEPPRRITMLNYRLDGVGFTIDRRPHVFVADPFAERPEPVQITQGDYDHADVTWSPDGGALAFVSARHANRDTTMTADIFICASDGSGLRQVTRTDLHVTGPRFSADGTTLFFAGLQLGPDGVDEFARTLGVWAVPADGSAPPTRLTEEERYVLASHAPLPVLPTADGVLAGFENRGAVELASTPLDGDEPKPVLSGQRQVTGYDAADGVIVATVTDPGSAGEVIAERGDGQELTLTSFGADMAQRGIRPMEEIEATAPDGYPVRGWIVRPEGAGPHPVLLLIHGGPFTQYGWKLFDEAQVYAGAGYAVVMGNPRGSSGYGRAHGLAIQYDVGARSEADLLALLDHALRVPDLDSDRLGVLGGSHGGYMTTWLLGRTDRFRAGISERALNAPDSFEGSSDVGWILPDQFYGTDPQRRRAQTPLSYADRITAPTLIIHSEQDWRCPVEQAQQLFVALKKRGVQTEFLLFPGEGHELSRSGLPSHRLARFEAILDWWQRYL